MEASALPAPAAVTRTRICIGPALLRLRSDEQLVALFRAGHDEAFRVIHDRYRQRLLAYTRQMLAGRHDAEDALQDVFVRAFSSLRTDDRQLALRAWLYRVAHNRCIDELRRPCPPPPEMLEVVSSSIDDPIAAADQRESIRRLIEDVRRLPEQQRSALLMRELGGMRYAEMADVLGVSVPAVKSLLVRARIGLARQLEARDTACSEIREEIVLARERGARASATVRRHIRDCHGCREFRRSLNGVGRQLSALLPAVGPVGALAKLLGFSGGAGGGAAAAGGVAGSGGVLASFGVATGAAHLATVLAAAVVTAGGAVEIQRTISGPGRPHAGALRAVGARAAPPAVQRRMVQVSYDVTRRAAPVAGVIMRAPVVTVRPAAPARTRSRFTAERRHTVTRAGARGARVSTGVVGAGTVPFVPASGGGGTTTGADGSAGSGAPAPVPAPPALPDPGTTQPGPPLGAVPGVDPGSPGAPVALRGSAGAASG